MDIWICLLLCATNVHARSDKRIDPRVYLSQMEHIFSINTYMILMDKDHDEYKMYNMSGYMHSTTRRTMMNSYTNLRRTYYPWNYDSQYTMCYLIQTIYRAATTDYRRYVPLRQLYTDHIEYGVGYMIFDILDRYQNILEIFQVVKTWFADQPLTYHYPVGLVLHLYTTILKQGKSITHLCNMLREIDHKYKDDTIFEDYTASPDRSNKTKGRKKKQQDEPEDPISDLFDAQNALAREQKKRARAKKKQRLAQLNYLYRPTFPSRLQKQSPFELHYGWSIEDWL